MKQHLEKLGTPDLKLAGLKIWVHNRRDDAENWLHITAHCSANGAAVTVSGEIIAFSEIESFLNELEPLYGNMRGEARLDCIEPELSVFIKAQNLGRMSVFIEITPDLLHQQHRFQFESDQSDVGTFISDCRKILRHFGSS